jgi:hypothetical protein
MIKNNFNLLMTLPFDFAKDRLYFSPITGEKPLVISG